MADPVVRQRAWQARKLTSGLCVTCGKRPLLRVEYWDGTKLVDVRILRQCWRCQKATRRQITKRRKKT